MSNCAKVWRLNLSYFQLLRLGFRLRAMVSSRSFQMLIAFVLALQKRESQAFPRDSLNCNRQES